MNPVAMSYLDTLDRDTSAIGQNYQARVAWFLERSSPAGIVVVYDPMGRTPYYADLDKVFID